MDILLLDNEPLEMYPPSEDGMADTERLTTAIVFWSGLFGRERLSLRHDGDQDME